MGRIKHNGFTLIELLITLTVFAVLAAIAVPSFKSILEGRRLTGATDDLYANLQFARTEAIKQNKAIQFQFNTGSWCYGIDDDGADCDCSTSPSACTVNGVKKVVSSSLYDDDVTLTASSFAGTSFTFSAQNGKPDDTGTWTLTVGGRSKQITLNAVGRVTVN